MNLSKIIGPLAAIAPNFATALGGPLAGMAVTALGEVLGITPDKPDDITQAIVSMSPDMAAKVRQADQDFQQKMAALGVDLERLAQEDRKSARDMQIATRDVTPRILAVTVVAGLFSLLLLMTFYALPAANHDNLTLLLGALSAAFGAVVQFYFGSSASSQAKDAVIKDLKK